MKRRYSIEAGLTSLYRRLGPGYVTATLGVVVLMNGSIAALATLIASRHQGFGFRRTTFSLAVVEVLYAMLYLRMRRVVRSDLDALRRWAAGDRDGRVRDRVVKAAFRLPALPVRHRMAGGAAAVLIIAGGMLFGVDERGRVSVAAALLWAEGGAFLLLFVGAAVFFGSELLLHPVRRELGPLERSRFTGLRSYSVTTKLIGGLGSLVLGLGFFVTAMLAHPRSDPSDLFLASLLTAGVACVMGLTLALPIARSVLNPVEDLIAGTSAIAAGDLAVEIPVTSSDELGELAVSFNEMLAGLRERESLRSHNQQLIDELRASRARIVAAADAERRRVERDLHDGAQQHLVLLNLKLSMAQRLIGTEPEAVRSLHAELRTDVERALTELRDLAHGIYPIALEADGLGGALTEVATRAATPTEVDCAGTGRYAPEIEAAVYFCCAEALQNVAKHAGDAACASVSLTERGGCLWFTVHDDGRGFDPAQKQASAGLQNMADRIGALGGTLTIASVPGAGSTITGTVPILTPAAGSESSS